MPEITVSDSTFELLKSIAEPLVDTPDSCIRRLIQFEADQRRRIGSGDVIADPRRPGPEHCRRLEPDQHPSLAFTTVLTAKFDGREIGRPNWNLVMQRVHLAGLARLKSLDKLRRATRANIREGRYEEEGYKYIEEGDFSLQGVDANDAWRHTLAVARAIDAPVYVRFQWRDHESAVHPGEVGDICWQPEERPTLQVRTLSARGTEDIGRHLVHTSEAVANELYEIDDDGEPVVLI